MTEVDSLISMITPEDPERIEGIIGRTTEEAMKEGL